MHTLSVVFGVLFKAVCTLEVNPDDIGQQIPAAYYERHKRHAPSPQELAENFRRKQRKAEKAKVDHAKYLHSQEYHNKLMHEANQVAQHARMIIPEDENPIESVHYKCGSHIPASALGLRKNEAVNSIFKPVVSVPSAWVKPVFVQSSGGPSMAHPGSGAAQVVKDIGRSKMGKVASAEKGKFAEPFVKVFKDGFSFSLCAKDSMYDFGDKYGFNKDQYKDANNVSIVRYEEVVLKESQQAMTPTKCYEFCRSVPDMVYFGIKGGKHCYCTPYFQEAASGSENCDMPCPGDPTMMCGGKEKSQIFEMHLCADTTGDLLFAAVNAEEQLVYFYDTAFMTQKFAEHLETIGGKLKKIAGGGGDPAAADLAQLAIKSADSLNDPNTGWGACKADYVKLLDMYEEGEDMYENGDFTFAKELQKAEDSMMFMENLRLKLNKCAKESEGPILEVYPFYHEIMAALDETELQASLDKYGDEIVGFVPVLYKIDMMSEPEMSSCAGEPLGQPMPLKLPGCAMACELHRLPRCVGFQYFQLMDGDSQEPLCFLFKEIKSIRSYRCEMLKDPSFIEEKAARRKTSMSTGGVSSLGLRGSVTSKLNSSSSAHPVCAQVAHIQKYSGVSCQSIWGKESKWVKMCPNECEQTTGAKDTALCMYRNSLNPPRSKGALVEPKQYRRCFGTDNGEADQANADFRIVEFGTDASGGAGPKIEGDITMGNYVVKEPYGYVWTPGPAGKR